MSDAHSSSSSLNSLFGCLQALCNHHAVAMSLTLEALEAVVAGRKGLDAAEAALVKAGFAVSQVPLTAEMLRTPGQSFPLLARRRRGGYVLVVGVRGSNGKELIGVYNPEDGKARARPWTTDLAAKALADEALEVTATQAARPSRDLEAKVAARSNPVKKTPRRTDLMADIYADAFENILVHSGTVRIDLATYAPKDKTNGDQPALELTGRLVMPIEGFVRAFGGIGEVVRQMVEAGVIEPIENPPGGRGGGRA